MPRSMLFFLRETDIILPQLTTIFAQLSYGKTNICSMKSGRRQLS
jgi:hypothetical protein